MPFNAVLVALLLFGSSAVASDIELPDMPMLEFLGSFDTQDHAWLEQAITEQVNQADSHSTVMKDKNTVRPSEETTHE